MDEMLNLVITGLTSGAAGGFISQLASNGSKWICDLLTAQSPEMQKKILSNVENCKRSDKYTYKST